MSRYSKNEITEIIFGSASVLAVVAFFILRILSTYGASEGPVPDGVNEVLLGDTFEEACDAIYQEHGVEYEKIGSKYWFDISDPEEPFAWLILKQKGGLVTEIELQTIRVPKKMAKTFVQAQSEIVDEEYSSRRVIHQYNRRRNYVYDKNGSMYDFRLEREVGSRNECYLDIRIYPYSFGRKIWESVKWACSFRKSLPVLIDLFVSKGLPF